LLAGVSVLLEGPVQHFIASYGYAAVFLLMLAESACIPVPSEVIMLFGGALAAGAVPGAHPALAGVIAAGAAGNVAGSYLAWAAGRHWGQAAVRRWGRRVRIREHDIDRSAAWFAKYGPAAVFFGRLIPVVRTFISLPAGFARMPAARFGAYTAAGCIPWTAGLAVAGYALGRNWQAVANGFHGATYLIAAVLVIALAAAVVIHLRGRRAGAGVSRQAARVPAGPAGQQPWLPPGPGRDWPRSAVSGRRCGRRSARPSSRY
jgi:membrane protein DedA with SNARE-associated domain